MSSLLDLYGKDMTEVNESAYVDPKKTAGLDLYRPSYNDGKDGVYRAQVRFIPFWKDVAKTFVSKYEYYLKDGDKTIYFESPKTVEDGLVTGDFKITDCIVQKAFSACYNSDDPLVKNLHNKFKRKVSPSRYGLILILKDYQKPELNGQIKIFRIPDDIWGMMVDQKEGTFSKKCFVQSIIEGRDLNMLVKNKDGRNNYSSSVFDQISNFPAVVDEKLAWSDSHKEYKRIEAGNKSQWMAVVEYLKAHTPESYESEVFYKDPTPEKLEEVRRYIKKELMTIRAYGVIESLLGEKVDASAKTAKATVVSAIESSLDELDDEGDAAVTVVEKSVNLTSATDDDEDEFIRKLTQS
jgi:hypothetical protein